MSRPCASRPTNVLNRSPPSIRDADRSELYGVSELAKEPATAPFVFSVAALIAFRRHAPSLRRRFAQECGVEQVRVQRGGARDAGRPGPPPHPPSGDTPRCSSVAVYMCQAIPLVGLSRVLRAAASERTYRQQPQ